MKRLYKLTGNLFLCLDKEKSSKVSEPDEDTGPSSAKSPRLDIPEIEKQDSDGLEVNNGDDPPQESKMMDSPSNEDSIPN